MFKSVIFDFDGTIADTFQVIFRLFQANAHEFGLPRFSKREIEKIRGMSLRELINKFGLQLVKLPYIAKKIRKELGEHMWEVELFPGIRDIIVRLKKDGIRLGLLSSNSVSNIKKFLKYNRVRVFDFIYSEQNLLGKGLALKHLLRKYNLKPQEVIYIGDEVRDIDACKEIGIKIISVTWGFNKKGILKQNKPDFIADNPNDILKFL